MEQTMRTESLAPMVPIELDKPRNLVYDNEAQILIEDELGESTFDQKLWQSISAKKARVILWAGLHYEDPSLTLEDVKKLLKGRNMAPIMKKILVAWGWSQPEPEDEPNPQSPDQSPQAGSTSGQ
jgi:hypothetical protein